MRRCILSSDCYRSDAQIVKLKENWVRAWKIKGKLFRGVCNSPVGDCKGGKFFRMFLRFLLNNIVIYKLFISHDFDTYASIPHALLAMVLHV